MFEILEHLPYLNSQKQLQTQNKLLVKMQSDAASFFAGSSHFHQKVSYFTNTNMCRLILGKNDKYCKY